LGSPKGRSRRVADNQACERQSEALAASPTHRIVVNADDESAVQQIVTDLQA
jgi:hypothetical protein